MNLASKPAGHGLGLRRALLREVEADPAAGATIDFWELAPENWIDVGGALGRRLREFSASHTLVAHGLALNLGGLAPLDAAFIARLRRFLDEHDIACYSEHLSFCADYGQLYDLLPIPFTRAAVAHVASRIREVQERLERRIAIENVSYYCAPGQAMPEIEFVCAVLEAADCDLLLDVNNIYVNSVNHGYDAQAFLRALPGERIAYAHIAGHERKADDLVIDTHGADVIEPVWELLDAAYRHFGVFPTLLERDFNLPPLRALIGEAGRIATLQQRQARTGALRTAIHA